MQNIIGMVQLPKIGPNLAKFASNNSDNVISLG